jgi:hypothetical protein
MAKNGILPVVAELWGPIGQARKLLTLVFYAMRDGEVRCLNQASSA